MKMTQEFGAGQYAITAYDRGAIRINQTVHTTSVIIAPDKLDTEWPAESFADLGTDSLEILLDWEPEVVVVGTGERQQFPPAEVFQLFLSRGVGIEIMDTGSACRTYNILMSEGRRVVAALLLI